MYIFVTVMSLFLRRWGRETSGGGGREHKARLRALEAFEFLMLKYVFSHILETHVFSHFLHLHRNRQSIISFEPISN